MRTLLRVRRGDVVLIPISFVSGAGAKVRPAVVVQSDHLNEKLHSTVIAVITSTNKRAMFEPSQLFIDLKTHEGNQTGLLHDSTVKCEHLDTVDRRDIQRVIGTFSPTLLKYLDACLVAALDIRRGVVGGGLQ